MDKAQTHILDASGKSLGRLASQIVLLLRGKTRPDFVPYKESQDIVLVKNIREVVITGKKREQKTYFSHSGYPGGEKSTPLARVWEKNPAEVLRRAVLGMLPDNRLKPKIIKRLRIE
jgi:large subunit ribosomal protein L13